MATLLITVTPSSPLNIFYDEFLQVSAWPKHKASCHAVTAAASADKPQPQQQQQLPISLAPSSSPATATSGVAALSSEAQAGIKT
jgi:hypothetical protein